MKKWYINASYQDGTQIEQRFNYYENGNAAAERERKVALEAWARTQHSGCICWSVCTIG